MILHMRPWLFALAFIYGVSISWWCGYLLLGDIQRRRAKRGLPVDHDAEILAVAQEGLDAAPELADDGEAVARTVLALEDVAELRALARADAAEASFRTLDRTEADIFLMRLFRTRPEGWKP